MSKKNPVAKYMEEFNRPSTQKDRKKASKRGYQKHKNSHIREFFLFDIKFRMDYNLFSTH